ncbi:MAG TPA: SDR family NAD(P)-dependent oxidoreductase [Desulfobacteraceae bacterium]|nr:SDR family NAD(P)-dependent oxidoreductase [Desulfobacteraceae bacterium]
MNDQKGIALVTGASSGIGREVAIRLSGRNYRVMAVARRKERLDELAKNHSNIVPYRVDLSDERQVEGFCAELQNMESPIDVLINNAGYSIRGPIESIPIDEIKRIFQVNLFSMLRITQASLPGMRAKRKGFIINISSIVGKFVFPLSGIYASTKFALEAINDALRMELRPFGIRVICIRPGVINTEFNEVANRLSKRISERTPKDYEPIADAVGKSMQRLFFNVEIPGPQLIANIVIDAIESKRAKSVYEAGPFVVEILGKRFMLDDQSFDRFWTERCGLAGLKV